MSIQQIGKKQLFIVDGNKLVSYSTIIGYKHNGTWYITTKKFSPTTSKQTTQFINNYTNCPCVRVSPEELKQYSQ